MYFLHNLANLTIFIAPADIEEYSLTELNYIEHFALHLWVESRDSSEQPPALSFSKTESGRHLIVINDYISYYSPIIDNVRVDFMISFKPLGGRSSHSLRINITLIYENVKIPKY